MVHLKLSTLALAIASLMATQVHAQDSSTMAAGSGTTDTASSKASEGGASGAADSQVINIVAKHLDNARDQLNPETGSSIYRFDSADIAALPLGENTPMNQVILQAPGVVQDSYGQLHVRGDHANLQYRIDGVIIPESMTGFGQSLDTRFANQVSVLTGALPAEYGYRTAGVIDIHTKRPDSPLSGDVSVVGGSNGYGQGGIQFGGAVGDWNYYLSGSHLTDELGIENPISTHSALHDHTTQEKGFGYLSHNVGDSSRVSFMFGVSNNTFQIPDVPGQSPTYTMANVDPTTVDSAALNAHQNEQNQFQVVSFQSSPTDAIDYQVSLFHRLTSVNYYPDPVGDLIYNGVAATIFRKVDSTGLQADFSDKLNDAHTLRAGMFLEQERFGSDTHSGVFTVDANGNQSSTTPETIYTTDRLHGGTYGAYLQDEWQVTHDLVVNYGVRADTTTTVTHEHQISPRIGLVYDWSPDTHFHAGYARYFTPPPTEIIGAASVASFNGTTNASSVQASTAIQAERSSYFDAGFTHNFTRAWSVGVDAYYRQVTHLQDEGQFGNALVFSAFNYNQGRAKGIELTTSYKQGNLSAYWNIARGQAMGKDIITGQYNFNAAQLAYISSNWIHLDHDQKLASSAGVNYRFGDLTLGGDLIYGSGLRNGFANTTHLPAYTQVNLSADESFKTDSLGKFDVRLAAVNVFDRSYEIRDGSGVGVTAPQFGPRRGFFLGLDKPF